MISPVFRPGRALLSRWLRLLLGLLIIGGGAMLGGAAPQVRLAWDANTEPDVDTYIIYYWDVATPGTVLTHPVAGRLTTTTTVTTGIFEGRTYQFYATARNTAGLESDPSNTTPPYTVPAAGGNQPPIANPLTITTAEDTAVDIALSGTDPEGASVSFLIVSPPANGALSGSGATRTYTPNLNFNGQDSFTYAASDGAAVSAPATASITVTPVNDLPTLVGLPGTRAMSRNSTLILQFSVDDVETAASDLAVAASSSNDALLPDADAVTSGTGVNRSLSLTPLVNQIGTTIITVTVTDGNGASISFNLTLDVVSNLAPTISSIGNATTAEDTAAGPINFTIGDDLTAPQDLQVTASSGNTAVVVDSGLVLGGVGANRTLLVNPIPNATGVATITLTVADELGFIAQASFDLVVTAVNDPPSISVIADQNTDESVPVDVLFTIADPDVDLDLNPTAVTLTAISSAPELVPDANLVITSLGFGERILTITPLPQASGTATITVQANDGLVTVSRSFLLTVATVNDPPTISFIGSQTTTENQPLTVAYSLSDPDSPAESLFIAELLSSDSGLIPVQNIFHGQAAGGLRTLTFIPESDRSGLTVIRITATDGSASSSRQFLVIVAPINHPPTLSGIPDQAVPSATWSDLVSFTVGDDSTPPSQIDVRAVAESGSLIPAGNIALAGAGATRTIRFISAPGAAGATRVYVYAKDGAGLEASTFFNVTVTPANVGPEISPIAPVVLWQNQASGPISFVAADQETAASALLFSANSAQPAVIPAQNIVLGGTGNNRTVSVTPLRNRFGSSLITVTVDDGQGGVASSAFLVTVLPEPTGDFDPVPDRRADVVFQHLDGSLGVWLVHGPADLFLRTFFTEGGQIAVNDAAWRLAATADLDDDGSADLIFQHREAGDLSAWRVRGLARLGTQFLSPVRPAGGAGDRLAAVADLNRDGMPDLVFQRLDGSVFGWVMAGFARTSVVEFSPGSPGAGWRLSGSGDFDRNGHPDLLFQSEIDGTVALWFLDGTIRIGAALLDGANIGGLEWRVAAVNDYDRNGAPDVLFQNPAGQLLISHQDGSVVRGHSVFEAFFGDSRWRAAPAR